MSSWANYVSAFALPPNINPSENKIMERYFVKTMRRLTNTPSGNPRFKFVVVDRYGETKTIHTKPDANWAYTITHGWENRMIEGYTHATSRNVILDYATISEQF